MSDYEWIICPDCNGSGEGQHESLTCRRCQGDGEIAVEIEDE